MDRALKYGLLFAVTAFFAVMWGLLLQRQMPLVHQRAVAASYADLLPPGEDRIASTWHISFAETEIGQTEVEIHRSQSGIIILRTDTRIELDPAFRYVIGAAGTVDLSFRAHISPLRGLDYFEAGSDFLGARLLGTVEETELTLSGRVGETRISSTVPYDEGAFLGDMLSPLAPLKDLDDGMIGRSWSVEMVNPIAARVQPVTVTVTESREVTLGDRTDRVYRLLFAGAASRWVSWVTADGRVILQGTPFGLVLRRSDLPIGVLSTLPVVPTPAEPPEN